MQITLVYTDTSWDGRGERHLVKAFLHAETATQWIEDQPPAFKGGTSAWSRYPDGTATYGSFSTKLVSFDDSVLSDDEVQRHKAKMFQQFLDTLTPAQRTLLEEHLVNPAS